MLVATIGFEPISRDYKSRALPIELCRYEAQVFVFRPHARRSRPWHRALKVTVMLSCSAGNGLPPSHDAHSVSAYFISVTTRASYLLASLTNSATAEHISFVMQLIYLLCLKPLCLSMFITAYV